MNHGLNRWVELLLLGAARVTMGLQFQAVGALGPLLVGPLVADYASLGTLIGAYSLAGVAVALPSGWLLARFGDRRMLLLGLGLMALGGAVLALAPGFGMAVLGRVIAGGGSALLTVACAKRVLDRFAGASLAPAMGIMLSAWPIGIALALLVLPGFGVDWRAALVVSALACALAWPLLWWGLPAGADAAGRGMPHLRLRRGEWGPLLAVGGLWASYNAGYAVVLGFGPAFLVAEGASPQLAGAVASLVGWAILPLLPIGGALAERTGRPVLVCGMCIGGMGLALLALLNGAPAMPALIAFGFLAAPPASLIMAFLGRVLSPESRAFGIGIHYMMFYGGLALLPPLAGWLRDLTGAPAAPIWAAAGFEGVAILTLLALAWLIRGGGAAAGHRPR